MNKFCLTVLILIAYNLGAAFAQEPQEKPPTLIDGSLTAAAKLTADEQGTFDLAKIQQVQAEAAVMKTPAYKDFAKAQQELQKAQQNAQAKQKAMLVVLQATPEYKSMITLRQMLEQRLKSRGEKNVIDWNTGELKKPAPQNARR